MATREPSGQPSAEAGADIPSAAELIERARALAPLLAQNVERCEAERRVPDENIDRIKDAGLYKVLQPRKFGGYELDFGVYIELAYELGKGCTATAWVYENNCMHSLLVGYMSEQVQHELWVDRLAGPRVKGMRSKRTADMCVTDSGVRRVVLLTVGRTCLIFPSSIPRPVH